MRKIAFVGITNFDVQVMEIVSKTSTGATENRIAVIVVTKSVAPDGPESAKVFPTAGRCFPVHIHRCAICRNGCVTAIMIVETTMTS